MKSARGGCFVFAGFVLLFAVVSAQAGFLITRDGRTFNGALRLDGTNVVVSSTAGEATRVPVGLVARAVFAEARSTTAAERPAHRTRERWERSREKLPNVSAGNLEAEYFLEREMKHMRFGRREETINYEWPANMPPTGSVTPRFTARWTGRLLVPTVDGATYSNTLVLRFDGGARLWLDDKLVLDTWNNPQPNRTNEVPFLAGRTYSFQLEYNRNKPDAFASVSRWTFDHSRVRPLAPGCFLPLRDAAAPPQVEFLQPQDGAVLRQPAALTLEAGFQGVSNAVQRVQFFENDQLLAEATNAPFTFTLKTPPAGTHTFALRAVDGRNATLTSLPIHVHIAGKGGGPLPQPWSEFALGLPRDCVRSDLKNGALALTAAGGEWREEAEAFGSVFQRIEGDFDFIARLVRFADVAADAQAQAGLFISGDFHAGSPRAALLAGLDGGFAFISRGRLSSLSGVSSKRNPLPLWLRLARNETFVQAFTSNDGFKWTKVGAAKLDLLDAVCVGLTACTKSPGAPATSVFDRIVLMPGAYVREPESRGVLLVSGSLLAEDLVPVKQMSLEGDKADLRLFGERRRPEVPAAWLARVIYNSPPSEAREENDGRTGILLENGDFMEGQVKSLHQGQVTVDSLLMGRKSFRGESHLCMAILREAQPASVPFRVTTMGGSRLLAKSVGTAGDEIALDEPLLGRLTLPRNSLAAIEGR